MTQDIEAIGKLSFATKLSAEETEELRRSLNDFGELVMAHHNGRGGKCPLCENWGAPTGCRCCGCKCMGG